MEYFLMYLFVKLDSFNGLLIGFAIAFLFYGFTSGGAVGGIVISAEYNPKEPPMEKWKRIIKTLKSVPILITGFIFIILANLLPTTKEAAVIYVVPKIVNVVTANKEIQKLPNNILQLANAWIEELKPADAREAIRETAKEAVKETTKEVVKQVRKN
jgi:hypothetical protein